MGVDGWWLWLVVIVVFDAAAWWNVMEPRNWCKVVVEKVEGFFKKWFTATYYLSTPGS